MSREPAARLALLAPTDQHVRLCPRLEAAGFEVVACESRLSLLAEVFSVSPAVIVVRDDGRSEPSEQLFRSLLRQRARAPFAVVASLAEADAVQRAVWLGRGADAVLDDTMSLDESRSILQACARRRGELEELLHQRSQLAAALDHVGDGVLLIDERGQVRHANAASLDLLGVDPDVLRQQSAARMLNVLGVPRETIDRVLRTEESFSETVDLHVGSDLRQIEVSCRRIDPAVCGEPRWVVRLRDRSPAFPPPGEQAEIRALTDHELSSSLLLLGAQLDGVEASEDDGQRRALLESARRELELLAGRLTEPSGADDGRGSDDGGAPGTDVGLRTWIGGVVDEIEPLYRPHGCTLGVVIAPSSEGVRVGAETRHLRWALRDVLVLLAGHVRATSEVRILAAVVDGSLRLRVEQVGEPATESGSLDAEGLIAARRSLESRGGHLQQERSVSEGVVLQLGIPLQSSPSGLPLA